MDHVQNFNLYGEMDSFPDVLHCETIQARSLVHDWEFNPHRHARLHQFLFIDSGGGAAKIENDIHVLASGTMLNIPAGVVHGFSFTPETTGWVVTLTSELLEQTLLDSEGVRPQLKQFFLGQMNESIRTVVLAIFAEYPTRSFARAHILRSLSSVLAGLMARAVAAQGPNALQPESTLQRRFEVLLEQEFLNHLTVADYADRLGVTPTHLTRVLRQETGLSASAVIETRILREARRNLAFSNLGVSEIAYQLGFSDPSYFSRVFKRAAGVSPRAFRQNLES